jgi:hypothetical protein
MDLYIKSSDSFIKLALAVLAGSVAFPTKDWPPNLVPPLVLLLAWILLLLAVAAGCLYQYLAIHLLDAYCAHPGSPGLFRPFIRHAGYAYGAMMVTFYVGAVLAFVGIYQRLVP